MEGSSRIGSRVTATIVSNRATLRAANHCRVVRLGDVAMLVRGVSYKPSDLGTRGGGRIALLRATNIVDGRLDLDNTVYVDRQRVSVEQRLRPHDIVVAMSSGSRTAVGKLAQLPQPWIGTFGAFCSVIRAHGSEIAPVFLGFLLRTSQFRDRIELMAQGTNIKNLSKDHLLGFEFQLPPLDEQLRIARILSTIHRARDLNAPVLAHSQRLKRKLIEHLFAPDSRPGNSTEWHVVPVGSLCTGVFDGPHATPTKTDEGPLFLSISSLNQGHLDLTRSAHLSESDFARWTRRVVPQADDVVFSYETRLGEVALLPKGLRCCLGRRLALMRPDTAKVEPWFLTYAYLSPAFQQTLADNTVIGSTVHRLPLNRFADFPIEVPSLETQRLIVRILREIDRKIECESSINRALESLAVSSLSSLMARRTLQTT